MKTICLALLLCIAPGGDRERGLQLYREGKFAEAAAAFRAAIEQDGDSPELQWNLALASWRAGDLAAAENAAEKYAALGRHARTELHAGLLGAVRHDEAKSLEAKADAAAGAAAAPAPGSQPEDPLPLLEQALTKATQARDHFVRAASANATPELLRNTERTLRTIDELQKKIDELKKQREQKKDEQQQQDEQKKPEEKKDDEKKDEKKDEKGDKKDDKGEKKDEQKQDGQPPPDDKQGQKSDQKQDGKPDETKKPDDASKQDPQQQAGKGEERPEPKPEAKEDKGEAKGQPPEAKPDGKDTEAADAKHEPAETKGDKPEPEPAKPRQDAPGEGGKDKLLTPEQAQRVLEQLREHEDRQKVLRTRKSVRPPVERDW